jgi:hypothetical protein
MRRWILAFSILFGFSLPVFAAGDASGPNQIALHLAVIDHMAFSDAAFDEVDTFVRESLPHVELKSLKVERSVFYSNRDRLRENLLQQITAAIAPNDVITHLIIDTHGDTSAGATTLAVLGKFNSGGGDSQLLELLAPLKGHVAPDVMIVLNSCSTLCGTDAADRVRGLLNDLDAPNGQVYGSTTPEVERPGALIGRSQWRAYFGDLAQLKLFITLGTALGLPAAYAMHSSYVASVAVASASIYAVALSMKAALARFGAVNLGRLMIFRNGELIENRPVEKYEARYEIYGSCSALFR